MSLYDGHVWSLTSGEVEELLRGKHLDLSHTIWDPSLDTKEVKAMDEGMKADDRFIHRSSITGEIVSKEEALANPETTVTETVVDRSPWMHEWIRLGELMEGYSPYRAEMINLYTVNAVIHAQMLKRP